MTAIDRDRSGHTGYNRSIAQASALVIAHLTASPADVGLSHERHPEGPSLYRAVAAVFKEIERMRLTSYMWDQVVHLALGERSPITSREAPDHGRN